MIDSAPLAGTVKVRLDATPEEPPRTYHRDNVSVIAKEKRAPAEREQQPTAPEGTAEEA